MATLEVQPDSARNAVDEILADRQLARDDRAAGTAVALILAVIITTGMLLILGTVLYCL